MNMKSFKCLESPFNNLNIDILQNGLYFGDKSWHHIDVCSPFNRLYFILSGMAYLENTKGRIMLTPGNVYLIPASTTYSYICENTVNKLYLHFNLEFLPGTDVFEELASCIEIPYSLDSTNKLIKLLDDNSIQALMAFKSELISILSKFMDISKLEHDIDWSYEAFGKYAKLLSYIKKNLSADFKISSLEKEFNYSFYTISRKFKEETGIGLKEYIEKMLIAKGKQALLISDMSVKEVSNSFKFCDQYYFSRFFKKHTGISPKEYRARFRMR